MFSFFMSTKQLQKMQELYLQITDSKIGFERHHIKMTYILQ